ncbi:hypothetical protein JOC85_001237 [Bacillus mesophilus]|uniref:NERD domain-containing protein n=1 Tax=Bacillus mesophilus TaxID=1808955 RepID=A0A6M0Q6M6_9BACI|nr:hypothetical protein [Bacillus mesophilus]MBM7660465.1 hypothetical protein [Bacillus mesophilus]NEY71984.1 hypothetical protein [Bacillus mesophilus]
MIEQKIPEIPIDYLVVISNPQTIIRSTGSYSEALEKVTTSSNFINKLEALERLYQNESVNSRELKKLTKLLLANNQEGNPDVLSQFNISKDSLIEGVQCPNCFSIPMLRKYNKWFCPQCSNVSKDAHIPSISDYFLLFDSTITSKRFRTFTKITSRSISYRMLSSMDLVFTGDGKARVYLENRSKL